MRRVLDHYRLKHLKPVGYKRKIGCSRSNPWLDPNGFLQPYQSGSILNYWKSGGVSELRIWTGEEPTITVNP